MPEGVGHCDARRASETEFRAQVSAFFRRWLLGQADGAVKARVTVTSAEGDAREVVVTIASDHRGEPPPDQAGLPVGVSLHHPRSGAAPEEFRVLLDPTLPEQHFTFQASAPFEFATVLRHYEVQRQGNSWVQRLSPDAQHWRKIKEAESLVSRGKRQEAEAAFAEALEMAPETALIAYAVGTYYLERGLLEKASEALSQAAAAPHSPAPGVDSRHWTALALVELGRLHDVKGERNEALAFYHRALDLGMPLATLRAERGLRQPYGPLQ